MKTVKVISFLVAWYLFSIATLFITVKFMPVNHRYLFDLAIATCLLLAAYIAIKENFLNRSIGRVTTFLALALLLWGGFYSFVYLGIFIYGDGL